MTRTCHLCQIHAIYVHHMPSMSITCHLCQRHAIYVKNMPLELFQKMDQLSKTYEVTISNSFLEVDPFKRIKILRNLYNLIKTHNDIHAGEIETSTTLAIRPELVDMTKAVDETLDLNNEYLDFTSDRGVSWFAHTKLLSKLFLVKDYLILAVILQKKQVKWDKR